MAGDPYPATHRKFFEATGVPVGPFNRDVAEAASVLVLAVKPQVIADVLSELREVVTPDHLVISIAAGVSLAQLAEGLGNQVRLVRVMPNTPSLVGATAAAFAAGPTATGDDVGLVSRLFNAVGKAYGVPEPLLDAVTGLSGSGPAFVYVMIEALADGGVRVGLPREMALVLAAQTVLGSAKMVLETGQHPGVLKDAVASPGGTTIAGLHALERGGVRAALMDAVEAATRRAEELGAGRAR
jgi:pyrroline-5-carboxylate reductase